MKRTNVLFFLTSVAIVLLLIYSDRMSKYSTNKEWREIQYVIDDFGKKQARLRELRFMTIHHETMGKDVLIGVSFMDSRNATLEQGRISAGGLAKDFLTLNYSSDLIYQRLSKDFTERRRKKSLDDFILDHFGFRLAYWDKNMNRPQAPYLAEIQYYNGVFHYYEADPKTQALRLIFEESYTENPYTK